MSYMAEISSGVKIYKIWIKKAKKYVGPTKDYPNLSNFGNTAFKELLEKEESKTK